MTRKITPAQLDKIEEAAKEERRSEWRWPKFDDLEQVNGRVGAHSRHIAMMDPATTLALIAEVRELRAKVERVREVHRSTPSYETCVKGGCENAHCFETAVGDYAHDDDVVGHVCYDCSDLSDEEPIYWPCDTIKALEEEA